MNIPLRLGFPPPSLICEAVASAAKSAQIDRGSYAGWELVGEVHGLCVRIRQRHFNFTYTMCLQVHQLGPLPVQFPVHQLSLMAREGLCACWYTGTVHRYVTDEAQSWDVSISVISSPTYIRRLALL